MSHFTSFFLAQRGRHLLTKSYLHVIQVGRRTATSFAICIAALSLTSCASDESPYHWKTSTEALNYYREFLEQSRTADNVTMEGITKDIVEWQTLEDSVVAFVSRDTTMAHQSHFYPMDIINELHDSVREEILNRAKAKPRTLRDVFLLKRTANRCTRDKKIVEAAQAALPFFLSLDSVNIYNTDRATIMRRYRAYLYNVEKHGIGSKEQWLSFMREEDRLFRSFVTHLHELDGISATDITKTTENIYKELFRNSASHGIKQDDLYLYMTMRTNRRLLTNSIQCVADIKANKIKSTDQQQAYLWMIMQPFISINELGMAVLTERQQKDFESLAKDAPAAIRSIVNRAKLDKQEYDNMPDLITKIYISSL